MEIDSGVAWLSSVRVVKYLVNSFNERNLYNMLKEPKKGSSWETEYDKYWEAKIMTNIHDPYELGFRRITMVKTIKSQFVR